MLKALNRLIYNGINYNKISLLYKRKMYKYILLKKKKKMYKYIDIYIYILTLTNIHVLLLYY